MRVLLFGANGQVGHALLSLGRDHLTWLPAGRNDCDLADAESVQRVIEDAQPDAIVNAAAYTAVDKAESDRERCFAVNAEAPSVMARAATAIGARLIHYSTDYVFDGTKDAPYVEEDPTGPRNVYGASKLAGEDAILKSGANATILRTSWVYSNHGSNFMKTMLRLGAERPELRIVADQHGAPTSAEAIAEATVRLLEQPASPGLFHMTAAGDTTWFGFAEAIFVAAGVSTPRLVPIATADYPTPAARPANSILKNDRFSQTFGFALPHWRDQLDAVIAARPTVTAAASR